MDATDSSNLPTTHLVHTCTIGNFNLVRMTEKNSHQACPSIASYTFQYVQQTSWFCSTSHLAYVHSNGCCLVAPLPSMPLFPTRVSHVLVSATSNSGMPCITSACVGRCYSLLQPSLPIFPAHAGQCDSLAQLELLRIQDLQPRPDSSIPRPSSHMAQWVLRPGPACSTAWPL